MSNKRSFNKHHTNISQKWLNLFQNEGFYDYYNDPDSTQLYITPDTHGFGDFISRPEKKAKAYRLTDTEVQSIIIEKLRRAPQLSAGEIDVYVEDAEVTIWGTVPNQDAKEQLNHLLRSLPYVEKLNNGVEVEL